MEVELARFRKEVVAPFSGQKFLIRRVRLREYLIEVGGLALPMVGAVQDALNSLREKSEHDPGMEERSTRFYVQKGVVSPKIWFGDGECPADQIAYEDLGSDVDALASEVIRYSSEVTTLAEMEKFFRGSGAGDPGSNGEALRPAPVDITPTGDI